MIHTFSVDAQAAGQDISWDAWSDAKTWRLGAAEIPELPNSYKWVIVNGDRRRAPPQS